MRNAEGILRLPNLPVSGVIQELYNPLSFHVPSPSTPVPPERCPLSMLENPGLHLLQTQAQGLSRGTSLP